MKNTIYFITANRLKFQIAQKVFKNSGFLLKQKTLETPEIQSHDLGEIAAYSASWAAAQLKHPVFLTDAGCFIEALNGFPGPFLKYTNHYLKAEDYLKLMTGQKNRQAVFKECLAYCEPGKSPELFFSQAIGKISMKSGKHGSTSINEVFLPNGFLQTESEIPKKKMINFWASKIKNCQSLVKYLKNKSL